MLPSAEICRRAHRARDPRFDGRFFVGVSTTGVFCRPVCPAPTPRAGNVRYFPCAAAALAAGYRPCRRCRPEQAPVPPRWTNGGATALGALRLIDDGFLDGGNDDALAARLGIGARQLRRQLIAEVGASPAALARSRRLLIARRLLDETDLRVVDVAMAAGFGSLRRFNDAFRAAFKTTPRAARRSAPAEREMILRLPLREPHDIAGSFDFLRDRALAGLEEVGGNEYRRRVGEGAWLAASAEGNTLRVAIPAVAVANSADMLRRVRRLFDLDAHAGAIDAHLATEPKLRRQVAARPGVRVPGVWDAFEGAVRAVLGQQVSVARASALAAAIRERFGDGGFPAPSALARADVAAIGIPGARGAAIAAIARQVVAEGDAWLADPTALRERFAAIRGLGPWTAEYAAMRVAGDPDAFPDSDWGVLKALATTAGGQPATPAAARRWAVPLRPWRAYACRHLWLLNSKEKQAGKEGGKER